MILLGDCVERMAELPAESIDAVVTDPPYSLGFMGKAWDKNLNHGPWAVEAFRLLKPGGHLLAFGGTRTYHRLASAIEDAGFEIRDALVWAYASGFPKSLDVSKAIDKAAGAERPQVGFYESPEGTTGWKGQNKVGSVDFGASRYEDGERRPVTAPATDLAKKWSGWGTALKPAWEPIVLARKPLIGSVARNVTEWGTGGLNIDGTRIGTTDEMKTIGRTRAHDNGWDPRWSQPSETHQTEGQKLGRWPANVILTDPIFDGGVEGVVGGGTSDAGKSLVRHNKVPNLGTNGIYGESETVESMGYGDSGTYSRFFMLRKEPNEWPADTPSDTEKPVSSSSDADTAASSSLAAPSTGTPELTETPSDPPPAETARPTAPVEETDYTRFLLIPKADRADREPVLRGQIEDKPAGALNMRTDSHSVRNGMNTAARANSHPTVKPTELMRHLVRLVTPPGGTVLDPFLGSGTTGLACEMEGFEWVGIEKEPEYVAIAEARLNGTQRGIGL